ncbi:MAG: response regulator [Cyanobacteria bacterium J06560_2]
MPACAHPSDFVLIVDDTPTNISVLAQTLKQADLSIRIANDGQSALKQVRKEPPSLILLDVQMPGMNGFETCRQLKADETTANIPIIFMTALADKTSRVEGLSLGAVDYIAKPFEQTEVLARVQIHLRLKQMSDQLAAQVKDKTDSLQHTRAQLVEQEKLAALGQLMAGVAHEINNPMTCIANNIEPAQRYVEDLNAMINLYREQTASTPTITAVTVTNTETSIEQQIEQQWEDLDIEFALEDLPKLLNSMQLSIERIKDLSTSLRSFSRGESTAKVPFDIHRGLDSTLIILAHRLKSSNQRPKIAVSKQYGNLPQVKCFPSAINQVLMNILANAIDALESSDANGPSLTIEIATRTTASGHVEISIADNGPGLAEGARALLFEPLFTTKPIGKGTGLGLSISHDIVVGKHQGQLECLSSPGEGCRFVVTLPIEA